MWEVARSTNKEVFKTAMKKMKDFSETAHQWLIDHVGPNKQWVRAFFPHNVVSDPLCNNNSESFNAFMREARDKPLITMLELIRSSVMERNKDRYLAMSRKSGTICVKIKKILDKNVENCVGYTYKWNGRDGFEVKAAHEQYIVDTRLFTCSCGAWQLNGIPCSHAIPCLYHLKKPLENYVNECYQIKTFLSTYSHILAPMNGISLWNRDMGIPLQPPHQERLAGRPKKNRKRDVVEIRKKGKTERLRKWSIVRCGYCRQTGHNVRRCPVKQQEKGEEGSSSKTPKKRNKREKKEKKEKEQEEKGQGDPIVAAAEPKKKQSKGKKSKKKEPTTTIVDPIIAAEPQIIVQESEIVAPEPEIDQEMLDAISKRREAAIKKRQDLSNARKQASNNAMSFVPPRSTMAKNVAENEDVEDDIQIIKVVKDPTVNPTTSQREARRAKRYLTRHADEQKKKKRKSS